MKYSAVRGTRDLFGKELNAQRYIEQKSRDIFELYGFNELQTPVFEETALFLRSIGEETDITSKEMYSFLDKKGRNLTLRPEGTASTVRAYIEHRLDLLPGMDRLFYLGRMYRYERPQSGRYREFAQVGAELFSNEKHFSSLEILSLALGILNSAGIEGTTTHINSLGCRSCREAYTGSLIKFITSQHDKLCPDCKIRVDKNPLRILDCKNSQCKDVVSVAPKINEFWDAACASEYAQIKAALAGLNMNFVEDFNLVRGLDYYNSFVFEVKSAALGSQDAVLAGGRYDGLMHQLGGQNIGAVGFAAGLDRLASLLRQDTTDNTLPAKKAVYLACAGSNMQGRAFELSGKLRKQNIAVSIDYSKTSIKASLRQADNMGFSLVLILGEDEFKDNKVTIKNLRTNEQRAVNISELQNELSALL